MRFFRLNYVYTRATIYGRIVNRRGWLYVGKIDNGINIYNLLTSKVEHIESVLRKSLPSEKDFEHRGTEEFSRQAKKLKP